MYARLLQGMFGGSNPYVVYRGIDCLTNLVQYCTVRGVNRVVTTRKDILDELVGAEHNPKINDYQGSLFTHGGLSVLVLAPLKQLQTVPYGKFVANRFISKLVTPESWREPTVFRWCVGDCSNLPNLYSDFQNTLAIACDIETYKQNLAIRCVGYTGIFIGSDGNLSTRTVVIPCDDMVLFSWITKFNALSVPKIFQRGKYDNSYLLRYNAPITDWRWDTAVAMHCWYSELPKDLGFLNAFFLREVVYWKDLAETSDLLEYYRYNGLDTWATANVWVEWMLTAPDWARRNYELEFPLVFPCLLAEMTGIERDMPALTKARTECIDEETQVLAKLRVLVGYDGFNPASPKQVGTLLRILRCDDLKGTGKPELAKAALRHPLNAYLIKLISKARELKKARTNYLRTDDDRKDPENEDQRGAKEFHGRILYALNPDSTDTGRLASREHHFWCGLQIQNITRGPTIKQTIRSSEGFYLGECDLEQAESRDTAYITGDSALISAVESERDFHSTNCSAFFGVPYEDIYDDILGKPKNKELRDLSKRVNHGANYGMESYMLIETMGLDKIWFAGKVLGLPTTDPVLIAKYLLSCFHRTYPRIKGPGGYYEHVITEVTTTQRIASRAYHHTRFNLENYEPAEYIEQGDWTRFTFGKPDKNKSDLNALIAHCPQSLNGRTLNEAWLRIGYYALEHPTTFRLHAQIHDSILFSYAEGYEQHTEYVKQCMEIPVTVRDVSEVVRTFIVPAALKLGHIDKQSGQLIRATHWSMTE